MQNVVNIISGAYTLPLIDQLFTKGNSITDMENVYESMVSLFETDRIKEAYNIIHSLFEIAEMEYPQEIIALEKDAILRQYFVQEFIDDFYEVIEDGKLSVNI